MKDICIAHHMATLLSTGANVTRFLVICQTWRRKHVPQLCVIAHPYFFASLGTGDVILLCLLRVKDYNFTLSGNLDTDTIVCV